MEQSEEGTDDDMLVEVPSSSYVVLALSPVADRPDSVFEVTYLLAPERPMPRRELADALRCIAVDLEREAGELDAAEAAHGNLAQSPD